MTDKLSVLLTAISALGGGTVIGASISAYYQYVNSRVARKIKQRDLYRLLIAELLNLNRHYTVTARRLVGSKTLSVVSLRKAKYKDTGLLASKRFTY